MTKDEAIKEYERLIADNNKRMDDGREIIYKANQQMKILKQKDKFLKQQLNIVIQTP